MARALAALGPQAVCIKLKVGGCLLLYQGRLWHRQAVRSAPTPNQRARLQARLRVGERPLVPWAG